MTKIREGNNKMFFFIGDNCFCQMLWMEEVERSGIRFFTCIAMIFQVDF